MIDLVASERKEEKVFPWTPLREKLGFHGVDDFSSQSLKDKPQET